MSDAVTNSKLVVPVGSGPLPPGLYAVACEFPGPTEVCQAAESLRDQGFKWWDCYTPYYVHGLDRAMGQRKSFVPFFTLAGGLGAASSARSSSSSSPQFTSTRWIRRASPTSACPPSCPSSTCS